MKKKNNYSLKNDNRGATLVMLLVIVSFLLILATTVTSAAMVNYKMKIVSKSATKTFYTAEEAVDEMYVSFGMLSMDSFTLGYQTELSNIISANAGSNGMVYNTSDNIAANKALRESFVINVLYTLAGKNTMINSSQTVEAYINSGTWKSQSASFYYNEFDYSDFKTEVLTNLRTFVEDGGPEVVDFSSLKIVVDKNGIYNTAPYNYGLYNYYIILEDCVVRYLDTNNYFANIQFDAVIEMPDSLIKFSTDADRMLNTFESFALIGTKGIASQGNAVLNGNAYAGKIDASNSVMVSSGSKFSIGADGKSYIFISNGDFATYNGGETAFGGNTELYTDSFVTLKHATSTADAKVNFNGTVYAKDDLELNADNSKVTFGSGSSYYGYMYYDENAAVYKLFKDSSAIIINGINSSVDLSGVSNLMISGRSYIDYTQGLGKLSYSTIPTPYATGESISIKSNQEIYLIPPLFFKEGIGNPYAYTSSVAGSEPTIDDIKNKIDMDALKAFFTKYFGTNQASWPVVVNDMVTVQKFNSGDTYYYYCYYNFKENVDNGTNYRALFVEKILTAKADDDNMAYIQELVSFNLKANQSSIVGGSNLSSESIKTNGALCLSDSAAVTLGKSSSISSDYLTAQNTYSGQFTSLCRTLKKDATAAEKEMYSSDMFNNFIYYPNFAKLSTPFNEKVSYASAYKDYAKVATDANLVFNDTNFPNVKGGVFIVDGDVSVEKNFDGLIIASGKITVKDGVTVTNVLNSLTLNAGNNVGVQTFVKGIGTEGTGTFSANDEAFRNIFNAYRDKNSGTTNSSEKDVSDFTYRDFVGIKDWKQIEIQYIEAESST